MVLGQGKVDDFSGESGGLSYRDYKDAYTNTYLVDESKVKQKNWWFRKSKPSSSSKYIFIKDPDGYDIEIIEKPYTI